MYPNLNINCYHCSLLFTISFLTFDTDLTFDAQVAGQQEQSQRQEVESMQRGSSLWHHTYQGVSSNKNNL